MAAWAILHGRSALLFMRLIERKWDAAHTILIYDGRVWMRAVCVCVVASERVSNAIGFVCMARAQQNDDESYVQTYNGKTIQNLSASF